MAKQKQINFKVSEEEHKNIQVFKNTIKEIAGRKPTYKHLLQQGIRNYTDDPLMDLRIEEAKKHQRIKDLELEKEKIILKIDEEIKKEIQELEEIKEKINGTYKGNLKALTTKKQETKEEKEENETILKEFIPFIKETIKKNKITSWNDDVKEIIRLSQYTPNYIKYNINSEEVEKIIKQWFNTQQEPTTPTKNNKTAGNKTDDIEFLNEEEETAFKKATEFILNRYNKHKQEKENLTLNEFWQEQNFKGKDTHNKPIYQIKNKYLNKLSDERKKYFSRAFNNLMINNKLENFYNDYFK